jgi:hypothetical protein
VPPGRRRPGSTPTEPGASVAPGALVLLPAGCNEHVRPGELPVDGERGGRPASLEQPFERLNSVLVWLARPRT